jgi:hypothetical protein
MYIHETTFNDLIVRNKMSLRINILRIQYHKLWKFVTPIL